MTYSQDPLEIRTSSSHTKQSFLVQLVLKTGWAETAEQAHKVLLAVAGACFLISIYLLFSTLHQDELIPPPPEEDIQIP